MATCIACKEEVKEGAKKCPHCHHLLSKWSSLSLTPAGDIFISAGLIVVFGWMLFGIASLYINDDLKNDLVSRNSTLLLNQDVSPATVSCFAEIENKSEARWGAFSMQAEFYDADKNMIDVHHERVDGNVYPLFSFKARVTGPVTSAPTKYKTCSIKIIDADDR